MLNIGILVDPKEKAILTEPIKNYFKQAKVKANIEYIKNYDVLFDTFFLKENGYNVVIIKSNDKFMYIKKISIDYDKNISEMISKPLEFPLDNEKLNELFFYSSKLNCPHGIYKINNKKTIRLVPYEDIDYFHSANKKRKLFLRNGEAEEIFQSNKMIKKQLTEDYFINCARGYIVNLFNIKKIDKINKEILLESGNRIPISKNKFQHVFKTYIKSMNGIKL
ncbi:MAG: LytTR family transcriptional regulator DNA-binding domain-containing protein [Sedimentibacter sp.]